VVSARAQRKLEAPTIAAFVSITEGVRNGTWEAVADDATCARICQTMAAAQQQVQHSITRLMRAIDTDRDEETSLVTAWGLNADEQEKQARYRQQALLQAAMYAPTAEPDGLTSASGTSSTDRDCNFCATGATGKDIAKTVTTPTPRGDTVHAVVYYENDDGTLELGGAQISNLEAPEQAPVETLRIPYRSMSAKVCVWVSEGKCMNVRSIVDSGAAQCAVSSKWLRQFPELWNARRAATHKFHGLTGEPLHTDGAVRLSFRMGTHTVSAWFHVFTNMHSPMLLGTNALIENRLVIDGADQQLYAKGVPGSVVPIAYKLQVNEAQHKLQLLVDGQPEHAQNLEVSHTKNRRLQLTPIKTKTVAVIQPHSDDAHAALLVEFDSPMIGPVRQYWLEPTAEFRRQFPQLTIHAVVTSSSSRMAFMPVSNTSNEAVEVPARLQVAMASAFDTSKMFTSDDTSSATPGRLSFKVRPPRVLEQLKGKKPTEEEMRTVRGLDLRDARDLGKEGAPLLTEEQRVRLANVFIEEEAAVSVDPKKPGTSDYMLIDLDTGDAPPQASKPYSIPFAYHDHVRAEIEKLLKAKLISPCTSAWASPVLVVVKKDHTNNVANVKIAVDLRKLNAVTENHNAGAIGEMGEIIDKFNGKPYASCMDISSGYYSFLVSPRTRERLCFVVPMSMGVGGTTFCWNRAPYGVAKLPAEFSKAIMTILAGTQEDVSSYIDDIACHTSTFERHLYALRVVLRRFKLAGLALKGSKCLILPPRLELLGFDITPEGVRMQHKKCKDFANYPEPSSRDEVQKYLGLVQFYRRWVDNLATIASPLTDLLKKSRKFVWGAKERAAFLAINEVLQSDSVMAFPNLTDPNAHYWVFTDASDVAAAGVLMQLQKDKNGEYVPKTLSHFSKVFDDTQRRWAIYEKESCAMMLAVTHWRKYLLGREFTCFTDSSVALTMLSKQRHTSKMQRWGMLLQEYMPGMKVCFKRSEENGASDALSRAAAFAKFVPQPENQMPMDDSLFDRLYQVSTNVRGTFGLYKPKEDLDLAEMWGVSRDATETEVIAMLNAQEEAAQRCGAQSAGIGRAAPLQELQLAMLQLAMSVREEEEESMEMFESELIAQIFDHTAAPLTQNAEMYGKLATHYGRYARALSAQLGRSPKALVISNQSALFATGFELASFDVIQRSGEEFQVTELAKLVDQGLEAIYLNHADVGHELMNHIVATLELAHHLGRKTPMVQWDKHGVVEATNFSLDDGRAVPSFSIEDWERMAHCLPHLSTHATCTERSVLTGYQDSRLASPHPMHGQLLGVQMAAAFMNRHWGMPLWTYQDVERQPIRGEKLFDWSLSGFSVGHVDSAADDSWRDLVGPIEVCESPRILQRGNASGSPSERVDLTIRQALAPSLAQRHLVYEQRRAELGIAAADSTELTPTMPPSHAAPANLPMARAPAGGTEVSVDEISSPLEGITRAQQDQDAAIVKIRELLSTASAGTPAEAKRISNARYQYVIAGNGLVMRRAMVFDGWNATERLKAVVPWQRRPELLKIFHTSPLYGHRSYQTLYELLSAKYYWAGMYSDCVDFVRRCEVCAVRKPFKPTFAPELHARATPARPFHSIALDVKGPLLTTRNNHMYILVAVCLLTRFIVAMPLADLKGETVARALVDNVFMVHGCSYQLQVDNASYFKGTTMKALTELFGIRHLSVLGYQPTSNGSAEAVVKKVSNALQRHGNAMRDWDRLLPLVVHGMNAADHPAIGVSPFYALFGREPVGPAELEWPDLQRLDVDGDEFIKSLGANLRKLWSDIKEASDVYKRQAVELANRKRAVNDNGQKPILPGDYVFVEYGDDDHSKRLGKAGLPRRRRFKVLEYHPDRFYVKIDTDGLRLNDKVSLHRISRAPREYTVEDKSQPITKLERMGHPDMPLPPGWRAIRRHGNTKDYYSYEGPGGRGRADSKMQAWREYQGDPVLMPQPKPATLRPAQVPALTDPLHRPLPLGPDPSATRSAAAPEAAASPLTATQVDDILRSIERLKHNNARATEVLHGWTINYTPRVNPSKGHAGDFTVVSPSRQAFRSLSSLTAHLRPAAGAALTVSDATKYRPGDRLEVFWTEDKKWFAGNVQRITSGKRGQELHRVRYDDGQTLWHDLSDEQCRKVEVTHDGENNGTARARAVIGQMCATRMQRKQKSAIAAQARFDANAARIQTLIWECEYGIWLTSNTDYPTV
jgi:hypothetical protein